MRGRRWAVRAVDRWLSVQTEFMMQCATIERLQAAVKIPDLRSLDADRLHVNSKRSWSRCSRWPRPRSAETSLRQAPGSNTGPARCDNDADDKNDAKHRRPDQNFCTLSLPRHGPSKFGLLRQWSCRAIPAASASKLSTLKPNYNIIWAAHVCSLAITKTHRTLQLFGVPMISTGALT